MYLTKQQATSVTDKNATNIISDQNMGHFAITCANDVVCVISLSVSFIVEAAIADFGQSQHLSEAQSRQN
jgi:hypothetical protein